MPIARDLGVKNALTTAILANLLWGLSPLYYYLLGPISPVFLLCLQIVMTFLSLALLSVIGQRGQQIQRRSLLQRVATAALIGTNWLAYLLAVLNGKAIDASFGYMIAPVLTMQLGQFFFKEIMTRRQKLGMLVCTSVMIVELVTERHLPLIGFLIALPFSLYVLAHKKTGTIDPVRELRIETGVLCPFAVMVLLFGTAAPAPISPAVNTLVLLALIGCVNAIPLILFVRASVAMTPLQIGGCQFISPVTSALLAVTLFGNSINQEKLLTFAGLAVGMALTVLPPKRHSPVT